jgi:hypothetical protein
MFLRGQLVIRAAGGFTLMRHKCRAPFGSERDCAESQPQQCEATHDLSSVENVLCEAQ